MTKDEIISKYQNKKFDIANELLKQTDRSNVKFVKIFNDFMNQILDCVIDDLKKLNIEKNAQEQDCSCLSYPTNFDGMAKYCNKCGRVFIGYTRLLS